MKTIGNRSVASFVLLVLNVTRFVVAIAVPFIIAVMSIYVSIPGTRLNISVPVSFSVDRGAHPISAPSLGATNADLRDVSGSLRFEPPKGVFLAINAAVGFGLFVLVVSVLRQLADLFRTLRDGRPFVPDNTRRVRSIAYLVILGELARSAIVFFENRYVMNHFSANGLQFTARFDLRFSAIVVGLIILVLAEVFRTGTRLDEEQSLTV